ncbi:hypothetical protein LOC67_00015 [Stieleria sp. JC731]|uniref:hypothetical protein n=1 Tax=Pirellulaceae TaxID=2691357 RepID=UPI001E2E7722|nr:hypothetical protein [Stieleria sp. JC731]MCC9598924.1 hypothetical protein [Stieleria sp. JC731]
MTQLFGRINRRNIDLPQWTLPDCRIPPLSLCHRELSLGNFSIEQYWVSKQGLYGTRGKCSSSHLAVLANFRCQVFRQGFAGHRESVEAHLLASLLPISRSNGSNRVFSDACLQPRRRDSTESVDDLDRMLRESDGERLSLHEFDRQNRGAIGFPDYSESTFLRYRELVSELLDESVSLWMNNVDAAIAALTMNWNALNQSYGRRRGNKMEKDVLDILSFESRAAFHQCYSALWVDLIPRLRDEQDDKSIFQAFHSLWHLTQRLETKPHPTHLLHGLALGLHPAFGAMLLTPTGRRKVAELIQFPRDKASLERFLHAGLVSLHHYVSQRLCR